MSASPEPPPEKSAETDDQPLSEAVPSDQDWSTDQVIPGGGIQQGFPNASARVVGIQQTQVW